MPSNTSGKGRGVRTNQMLVYDTLPAPVRHALANADENWSAHWCRSKLQKGVPMAAVINAIQKADGANNSKLTDKREASTWLADLGL